MRGLQGGVNEEAGGHRTPAFHLDDMLAVALNKRVSGDTTPCGMTGVTLHGCRVTALRPQKGVERVQVNLLTFTKVKLSLLTKIKCLTWGAPCPRP